MRTFAFVALLAVCISPATADVVFAYPPNGSGNVILSSWVYPDGSENDMYAYENFTFGVNMDVTEIRWRGGYNLNAPYGHVYDFSIYIYASTAGGTQPLCSSPEIENVYLVCYVLGGNAGETYAGLFGGRALYDYSFVLPTPFTAVAGTKYWVRIEGYQPIYPDWGLAVGLGGNNQHFAFSTGTGQFFFAPGDTNFSLFAAGAHPGDLNCDGLMNFDDISPFVLALSDPVSYQQTFPSCDIQKADCNGDGFRDFDDINAFVALLSGG